MANTKNLPNKHNVRFAKCDDYTALIDSGYEDSLEVLKYDLQTFGKIKPEDLTYVIITHAHPDHNHHARSSRSHRWAHRWGQKDI